MDLGIQGRRAAVAASTAGLGLATAKALAEAGAKVLISGRGVGRLTEAQAQIPDARAILADVSTPEGAAEFAADAARALGGPIDILVTNAGGPPPGTFATTPLEAYGPALDLNLLSVVAMCQAAVPHMREQKWGRVLAITSISVRQPIPILILSNTARAGVTGFLKTLALEVAADGVTVNSIQPGLHATERLMGLYGGDPAGLATDIPAGVVGEPEDFGKVAAFLCSEPARFITGVGLPVDGGQHRGLQ
jgi:3-oxoacyl-[acyl-carrier protein] reductase